MHALIDADRIAYAFGGFTDDDGYPLGWPLVAERIDSNIENLIQRCGASSWSLYLTGDDKSNFRLSIATIRPYKGHRSATKTFWHEQIRRYLIDQWKATAVSGMEADDAIGIEACRRTNSFVICSVDKDLDMIPGKHFNELKPERGIYEISEIDALRNFYIQLCCGDPTDNIPGLYGVGRSSALCKRISSMVEELCMYSDVREQYEKRFGSYWELFLWENAKLLWIKREDTIFPVMEIMERLLGLEELRKLNLDQGSKTESVSN